MFAGRVDFLFSPDGRASLFRSVFHEISQNLREHDALGRLLVLFANCLLQEVFIGIVGGWRLRACPAGGATR